MRPSLLLSLSLLPACAGAPAGDRAAAREPAPSASPRPSLPPDLVWQDDLDRVSIPERPVGGQLRGEPFAHERATLNDEILKLTQGRGVFPDLQITVFLDLGEDEDPSGRVWRVEPHDWGLKPQVHIDWLQDELPQCDVYSSGFSLYVQFGDLTDDEIAGWLYVALPDEAQSVAGGYFVARVIE